MAALNDARTQQPKVAMKKELNIKRVDGLFHHTKRKHVESSNQESISSALKPGFDSDCENVEGSGFESSNGVPKSPLMPCKTILVKQRPVKTVEGASLAEDGTKIKREHNTKRIAVESPPRDSRVDARQVALQSDSNFQSSETFEIKKGVVRSQPIRKPEAQKGLPYLAAPKKQNGGAVGNLLCSATANPCFPLVRPNQATGQASAVLPTSSLLLNNQQCASSSSYNTIEKPQWNNGKPCLPSIKPERKQLVEDFLEKHRRKQQQELEDDFESWGEQDEEPEEVKRILERPMTARLPRYPTHWDPLPNERPPGRGGQGYCLGVLWKKPEKSFLSESSSEGK